MIVHSLLKPHNYKAIATQTYIASHSYSITFHQASPSVTTTVAVFILAHALCVVGTATGIDPLDMSTDTSESRIRTLEPRDIRVRRTAVLHKSEASSTTTTSASTISHHSHQGHSLLSRNAVRCTGLVPSCNHRLPRPARRDAMQIGMSMAALHASEQLELIPKFGTWFSFGSYVAKHFIRVVQCPILLPHDVRCDNRSTARDSRHAIVPNTTNTIMSMLEQAYCDKR
jgi:hypothetical protein